MRFSGNETNIVCDEIKRKISKNKNTCVELKAKRTEQKNRDREDRQKSEQKTFKYRRLNKYTYKIYKQNELHPICCVNICFN